MSKSEGPLLDVTGLSAGYGDVRVLRDISLAVRAGETSAILGPNGHGKTTLLRTISGLHRAVAGKIVFDGVDITRARANRISSLGLVHAPQGDLLFAEMTVIENLQVGAYDPGAWRHRIERLELVLDIFPELNERRDSLARNLSGGERRMTAVGRALMSRARLIMIDEPSLGLAPMAIEKMYAALVRLKEQGLTILLVEEAADRVVGIADVLHLLDAGAIVRAGAAREILQDEQLLKTYLG
jgi:branched-chain amino acid transport system ATP-binding protein